MSLPLGIVRGLPFADYLADPGVSNSMLSSMRKSPAHCYALHLDPNRPPDSRKGRWRVTGSLAHVAILEPGRLESVYVSRPEGVDFRTKAGKEWRDAQTLEIVSADEYATAQRQRAAVHDVACLRSALASGDAEVSLFWIDADTGLRCKARPDWLHYASATRVIALDLKTTRDLTPDAVSKAVTTYGYYRQRAHYADGIEACGLTLADFGFAFVSSAYPIIAAPYVFDDETIAQGHSEVAHLRQRIADCMARNEWPAFGDQWQVTGLTKWARDSGAVEVSFVEDDGDDD